MNYYTLNLGFSLDSQSIQTGGFLDPEVTSLTSSADLSEMSKLWLLSTDPPDVDGPFALIETDVKPVHLLVGDIVYVRVFYTPFDVTSPMSSSLTLRVSVVFGSPAASDGNPKAYRTPFSIVNTNAAQAVFVSSDLALDESGALLVCLGTVSKAPEDPGQEDSYSFIVGVAVTDFNETWHTAAEYTFGHDPEMDVGM